MRAQVSIDLPQAPKTMSGYVHLGLLRCSIPDRTPGTSQGKPVAPIYDLCGGPGLGLRHAHRGARTGHPHHDLAAFQELEVKNLTRVPRKPVPVPRDSTAWQKSCTSKQLGAEPCRQVVEDWGGSQCLRGPAKLPLLSVQYAPEALRNTQMGWEL